MPTSHLKKQKRVRFFKPESPMQETKVSQPSEKDYDFIPDKNSIVAEHKMESEKPTLFRQLVTDPETVLSDALNNLVNSRYGHLFDLVSTEENQSTTETSPSRAFNNKLK